MRPSALRPRVHLFVCANRRDASSPLGPGCGEAGERVFGRLKELVFERGEAAETWVTQTACLGLCPRAGAAVAIYPVGRMVADVTVADAPAILDAATQEAGRSE